MSTKNVHIWPVTILKRLTKECYKQKSRSSSCDPALSVYDNVSHHQHNTRDQHVNTFTLIGSQLVVMVLRAQWPLGTIAQCFLFFGGGKNKDDKKKGVFMTGLPEGYPSNNDKGRHLDQSQTSISALCEYLNLMKWINSPCNVTVNLPIYNVEGRLRKIWHFLSGKCQWEVPGIEEF